MKTLFSRSCFVIEELATRERRTSFAQANNFKKFIDRNLIILDRHIEAFFSFDSKFEELQDFILLIFERAQADVEKRFDDFEKKMKKSQTQMIDKISRVQKRCNIFNEKLKSHVEEFRILRAHINNLSARY
jgi:hypothetical protein